MRIGVSFDGFTTTRETLDTARAAVDAGARSLWMAEHLGYREASVTSMAMLMATEGATVVPTAISPYLWHPTPTAMALATLAETGEGRTAVAVGTGNPLFLGESGQRPARPVRVMAEFVECLRRLWSGEAVHLEGEHFQLFGARMAFRPPAPIPIYVAAMGPGMLRLAGRIGDGIVLSAGLSAAHAARSLDLVAEAAEKAGRDPAKLRRASYLYLAVSKDGKGHVERLRGKLAFLLRNRFLTENVRSSGIDVDQDAIIDAVARRDMDTAARLVPDEAVEAFAVGGTPAQCRDRLRAYVDAGIEEPVLCILGGTEERGLALSLLREFGN